MHKQPAYLYKNVQELYTDLDPKWMGYRKVYARTLKLYKGIDNSFTMKLMNGDQKLLDLSNQGQTLWFQILDRDTAELKFITSMAIDCNTAPNSFVTLSLSEGDLEPLNSGHYMYSTYLQDATGKRTILYGDSQFGASVPVEIIENAFPNVLPSQEVLHSEFITAEQVNYVVQDNSLYTSSLNGHPDLNSNTALHTAALYCTGYSGQVEIQVTLENGHTDIIKFSVLKTITVTPDQTIIYDNFNGIYSWVRFRMIPDLSNTGTIDKILYRS